MGIQIAHDRDRDIAILYCSTTDVAFGPVFSDGDDGSDAEERAEAFLRWLDKTEKWSWFDKEPAMGGRRDARQLTDSGLQNAYSVWLVQEAQQRVEEEAEEAAKYADLDS